MSLDLNGYPAFYSDIRSGEETNANVVVNLLNGKDSDKQLRDSGKQLRDNGELLRDSGKQLRDSGKQLRDSWLLIKC